MNRWFVGQQKRYGQPWWGCVLTALVLASITPGLAGDASPALPKSVRHLPQAENLYGRALQGEANAQALLGDYCYSVADYPQAIVWYRKAASQGNVGAKLSMACCYKLGRGVEKNLATANQWYRQALLQWSPPGHPDLPQEPERPRPASPKSSPQPTIRTEARSQVPSDDSRLVDVPLSPAPDQEGTVLVSSGACSKRIRSLQPPRPLLLDVRVAHQPYR